MGVGDIFNFTLRIGQNQGYRITGTVTPVGVIKETTREASINTCPICLAKGTLISRPDGTIPVEQLREGMAVWTLDGSGALAAAVVLETSKTPVPAPFRLVRVTLADGRTVTASPGHPTAEGKGLGSYQVGDALDGSTVAALEYADYDFGATYDLLPSGLTGLYWADGVLLRSTLALTTPDRTH